MAIIASSMYSPAVVLWPSKNWLASPGHQLVVQCEITSRCTKISNVYAVPVIFYSQRSSIPKLGPSYLIPDGCHSPPISWAACVLQPPSAAITCSGSCHLPTCLLSLLLVSIKLEFASSRRSHSKGWVQQHFSHTHTHTHTRAHLSVRRLIWLQVCNVTILQLHRRRRSIQKRKSAYNLQMWVKRHRQNYYLTNALLMLLLNAAGTSEYKQSRNSLKCTTDHG